jgi:hypothetical protein
MGQLEFMHLPKSDRILLASFGGSSLRWQCSNDSEIGSNMTLSGVYKATGSVLKPQHLSNDGSQRYIPVSIRRLHRLTSCLSSYCQSPRPIRLSCGRTRFQPVLLDLEG